MAPHRTRTRQHSSDEIEEQVVTQKSSRAAREDVSDDDGESSTVEQTKQRRKDRTSGSSRVRVSNKARAEASASTSRRRSDAQTQPPESDEDEQDETNAIEIDVDNFGDQPLKKQNSEKVSLLAGDWDSLASNMRNMALKLVVDAAAGMAEAGMGMGGGEEEENAKEELETIEMAMRELLDVHSEMKLHKATLEDLTNRIARGEEISDIVNQYDLGVKERVKAYSKKTSRQKYAKEEKYVEYKTGVYEVQNPDEPMPPITELIPREDGDESDDDDDIEVGGVTQDYKCPLTLTTLVDPLRSRICKHFFSSEAIRAYFKQNMSARKKCPATGCGAVFGLEDLQPDKDLERKVKAYKRRQMARRAGQRSDDEDDDEVL